MTIDAEQRIDQARELLNETSANDKIAYAQVVATLAVAEGLVRLVQMLERIDEGPA